MNVATARIPISLLQLQILYITAKNEGTQSGNSFSPRRCTFLKYEWIGIWNYIFWIRICSILFQPARAGLSHEDKTDPPLLQTHAHGTFKKSLGSPASRNPKIAIGIRTHCPTTNNNNDFFYPNPTKNPQRTTITTSTMTNSVATVSPNVVKSISSTAAAAMLTDQTPDIPIFLRSELLAR